MNFVGIRFKLPEEQKLIIHRFLAGHGILKSLIETKEKSSAISFTCQKNKDTIV